MAFNSPKINSCIFQALKNKINSLSSIIKQTNRSCSTINNNPSSVDDTNPVEVEEVLNNTYKSLLSSHISQSPMQHDKYLKYRYFRQLQPAHHPEFMHSCMPDYSYSLYQINANPEETRTDYLNITLENVGTAVPFTKTILNEDGTCPILLETKDEKCSINDVDTSNKSIMRILTRSFSSKTVRPDEEKCSKALKKKTECKKFKMDCEPAKKIKCKLKKRVKPCTKQESPYPSYSESCHEEYEEKPSECKLCPWAPNKHPTFKPPKKKFHTISTGNLLKREDCPPPPKPKVPCGWVKDDKKAIKKEKNETNDGKKKKAMSCLFGLDKKNSFLETLFKPNNNSNRSFQKQMPREKPMALTSLLSALGKFTLSNEVAKLRLPKSIPIVNGNNFNNSEAELKTLFIRAIKKPCKRPPPKCPHKDKKKPKPKPKVKKCDSYQLSSYYGDECVNAFELAKKGKKTKKEKCKKFPFPAPPKPKRKPEKKCPVVKKHKIKDCPPENTDCERCNSFTISTYILKDKKDKEQKKKDCPKVDVGVCKDLDDDDPCGLNRKGKTYNCPADLTKRKKKYNPRKHKKTSSFYPTEPVCLNISPSKQISPYSK